jgi:ribonucleoside-diphosphate reductase alpha chain
MTSIDSGKLSSDILSEITTHMKYAKYVPEKKRRETWTELVTRNKEMHQRKYPNLHNDIEKVYADFVLTKKVLPSMRSLQFAGKPIEVNPSRLYNCSFLHVNHIDAFSETIFLLLSGTGVGVSVQKDHVDQLPPLLGPERLEGNERARRYLVGDSIEGWADAVKVLIEAWFKGKKPLEFDYRDVRAKGEQLMTSGGKAPGPGPLRECITQVTNILEAAVQTRGRGTKLRPIEVHDIICHLADAVLAGGIRRAALISLFSFEDEAMLTCKTGNWWEINPQRGRANNSVVLVRDKLQESDFFRIWKKIEDSGSGEPGIFLTNDAELGVNPCLTGDSIIRVKDGNVIATDDDSFKAEGISYDIPLKMLIEKLDQGNEVYALSFNESIKEKEWKHITAGALTRTLADVIELEMDDGTILKCTPDHKVFTTNRGYVEAKDLTTEDDLVKM